MNNAIKPPIWLIIFIAGLPQLSETVYTPCLPTIANALQTTNAMVEHTLTIYLFGFALGTFFWGKLSDIIGRKPCIVAGLLVFIVGCTGCYFSSSIYQLLISRCIQAFGGSIGSVLGQALCRDAFKGPDLGRVYSAVGSSLALFPALGPICGGVIADHLGWYSIFAFLGVIAVSLVSMIIFNLPETHFVSTKVSRSTLDVALELFTDKKIIGFGLIVAACNAILFSYFAEGSFYLISMLGVSTKAYGFSFIMIACATMLGGLLSRMLQRNLSCYTIMDHGIVIIVVSTFFFSVSACINHYYPIGTLWIISIAIMSQMINSMGICMATSNALALSLVNYKTDIGTASSLFGFFYYSFICLFTFIMGLLHNGSLLTMPLYFFSLSIFMLLIRKLLLNKQ